MEKFAVDLDKVLDDFELDEDESESVNQYEKLQLEFCADGRASIQSSAMRHNIGLGAFGGWSEPQAAESTGSARPWCRSGLGEEVPQPPGTRSPPDGQNDDGQQSAACSQLPPSLPFQAVPLPQQPQQSQQLQQPVNGTPECADSRVLPGLPQQPTASQALWPAIAASSHGSYSPFSVPEAQPDPGNEGTANPRLLPASSPEYDNPEHQERGGAVGECSGGDEADSGSGLPNKDVPFGGLDVIASRPLDVVPSSVPSDWRVLGGHEGRHPDIIDVWQSGAEGGASAGTQPPLPGEVAPPPVAENAEYHGASAQGVVPEVRQSPDSEVAINAERPELGLLPDLMSMNNGASSSNEGVSGVVEYPDPAVVMENALSNASINDPAIVVESRSCGRISEVVNVHQTAENRRLSDVVSSDSPNSLLSDNLSDTLGDARAPVVIEAPGILRDHVNPARDNPSPNEAEGPDTGRIDLRSAPHVALPDVSAVNPVPLSFNKDEDVDDADLDAELAEMEEEQFRLQGAYGGSLARSLSGGAGGELSNVSCSLDSGTMGGPDLIGGTGASIARPSDGSGSDPNIVCSTNDDQNPPFGLWQQMARDEEPTASEGTQRSALESHENAEFLRYEGGGVEEVICQPQNNDYNDTAGFTASDPKGESASVDCRGLDSSGTIRSKNGEAGDNVDNISNTSTGTDTISSSSTLTDGDLGSPERRPQHPTSGEPQSPSRVTPGTLVTAVYDDDSGSGREDECSEAVGGAEGATGTSSSSSVVGQVAPFWIPDEEAPNCQECGQKFTVIRRRHHCRACGRVLCAQCCHHKAPLPYMEYKEARVCGPCLQLIQLDQKYERGEGAHSSHQSDSHRKPPDPNNPMEYCSRVPPPQQAAATATAPPPTVMVPVGVLKREGSSSSSARSRGSKQVIFSDGIRPGGDLTELDGSGEVPPPYRRSGRVARRVDRPSSGGGVSGGGCGGNPGGLLRSLPPDRCLIPPGSGLPPVVVQAPSTGEYVFEDNPDSSKLEEQMRGDGPPVVFAIHKNLTVLVKVVKLECCVGVEVWNIATRGLCTVGQEEMVVLLEVAPGEAHPPRDIFAFFHTVYQQAHQGNLVTEMGHTIFTEPEGFLGSREHGGFLYIRPTFQCLRNLVLPPSPYIFAVLIQKWETPWAKVFPLRLMLRMGAEFRYYPCPLVSTRNRKPVFCEIGHTIMNLLVDFRNYAYTVPTIEGFVIHMEDKRTTLLFPKNRYEQVTKALSNSNDHVLALGSNFSPQADSHLVTIENDDGHYSTQAINIHNRPRKVTGASFIVFNGALKTTSGLSAKSSIVEDGLMVQIPSDMMTKLRDALRNMKDFDIPCGPVTAEQPDEVVLIKWTSDDKNFNVGIKSPVDERQMDGVPSVKIHSGTDYVSSAHLIRWTEVFILQGETNNSNDINLSRLSEVLARAFCVALTPHLTDLYSSGYTRLALRSTVHQDSVGYEAGSSGSRLPAPCMNDLDTELIPVIHRAATNITDEPIVLELVFHIMEQ